MPSSLVIFDLDGTLVDSLPDIAGALNHALASAGGQAVPLQVVRGYVGDGVVKLAERALRDQRPQLPLGADALADRIRARYHDHVCDLTRPYEGVRATAAALASSGRRLAVLTNKPGDIARRLMAEVGLADLFQAVIGDADGYPRKPDPGAVAALAARFGASPATTLMVGDGIPDLQVARAFGCPVAAAAWGYTDRARLEAEHPDWIIEQPADVLRVA